MSLPIKDDGLLYSFLCLRHVQVLVDSYEMIFNFNHTDTYGIRYTNIDMFQQLKH